MTETYVYVATALVAVVLGVIAGRVFAYEADNRLGKIFAGTYVGAGVGLASAVPMGSLLSLVAQYLQAGSSTWFDAVNVAGMSLLYGAAGGAAGGLGVSLIIAALNLGPGKRRLAQS